MMSTEVSAQPSISSIVEVEATSEDSLFKLQRPPSLGPDLDLEEPEPESDDKLMMTEYDEDNVIVIDLTEEKRNSASLKKSKSEDIGVLDQDEPSMPRPFFDLSDLNGGEDSNEDHTKDNDENLDNEAEMTKENEASDEAMTRSTIIEEETSIDSGLLPPVLPLRNHNSTEAILTTKSPSKKLNENNQRSLKLTRRSQTVSIPDLENTKNGINGHVVSFQDLQV